MCIPLLPRHTVQPGQKSVQTVFLCGDFSVGTQDSPRRILHIADNGLYAGIWCPEQPVLNKLRHAIVDNIEEFEGIMDNPQLKSNFPLWAGDTLKTIPKGWQRNHPNADLLRRKDYGRFCPCEKEFFMNKDWPLAAAEKFRTIKPFVDFLNYSIDE